VDRRAQVLTVSKKQNTSSEVIAAVVVSFEPDAAFDERLAALASQVDRTIVIDNSVDDAARERVQRTCRSVGYHCRSNGRNLGVAEALNQGVRLADEMGVTHVLTMDQDSVPWPTMVAELRAAMQTAGARGLNVGIVAATPTDRTTGIQSTVKASDEVLSEAKMAITSGSLIPMAVLRRVGLFRSDYFIDAIDQEFCLRIRGLGYTVIHAHRAHLTHQLGAPTVQRVLGMTFIPTNHSPMRRYYMARNTIWTTKLFFFTDTRAAVVITVKLLKNALLIAVVEDNKGKKLKEIVRGLVEGITTKPDRAPMLA
jgi:rhamnosyltransferase